MSRSGADELDDSDIELRHDGEKRQLDTTTVVFQQTWHGLPVRASGCRRWCPGDRA